MAKPKIAFYWCASCGGCEEAVVDLNEALLKVADAVDIVLWPVALDFKRKHVEAMDDKEIAVSFVNGAVRLDEQREMVELLRRKSRLIVAFGACAHLGGIPGLGNFYSRGAIFETAYTRSPSLDGSAGTRLQQRTQMPEGDLTLPAFYDTVQTLDQTIDVDYYLPGCPPPPDLIQGAVDAILTGNLPEKGAVLAPSKALCDACPRADSKPEKLSVNDVKRPWEIKIDPETCFLAQGLICAGPATRSGCGETCIRANQPCRGCFGPVSDAGEQGARMLSMVASILGVDGEDEMNDEQVQRLIDRIADPAGTFYRYSLPVSLLKRKRMHGLEGQK